MNSTAGANVYEWLRDIADCRNSPERVDLNGVELGLNELFERSQSVRTEIEQLDPEQLPGASQGLYEMLDLLDRIVVALDGFMEDGLFFHLDDGLLAAKDLVSLRDHIENEQEQPNLASANPQAPTDEAQPAKVSKV